MKVIFTDNVQNVASTGDVKNVKKGFFRNYLLPRRKAALATEQLLKEWEERRKKLLIAKEQLKTKHGEIKQRLDGIILHVAKKVTQKGTLYGGIKPADIVKALKDQVQIEIPENAVAFEAPIKAVGAYKITLKLEEGMETAVALEVAEKNKAP